MSNSQCHDRAVPTSGVAAAAGGSAEGGGAPGDSGGEVAEGDEQEESSSSNFQTSKVEDALTTFREQWQRELEMSPRHQAKNVSAVMEEETEKKESENLNTENEAKSLFLKGVENEQNGKFYEAIQFYRRAVQLVPDIEFRLYDATKPKVVRERQETLSSEEGVGVAVDHTDNSNSSDDGDDDDDDDDCDLLSRLQRLFSRTRRVCVPHEVQTSTHFSALPMEIMLYLLRWVVSSDLDMRSLEMCSRVCRGFYLCSRDPEIWRLACVRVWGVNCGGLANYESWRKMFIERPRLHFNGCYISKTTYMRHGENSFQDRFYRPWQLVEYYRYLRFFPEGMVLMLTTPDDPMSSLGHLRHRTPRNLAVLCGHCRLHEDRVLLMLRRQKAPGKTAANNRYRGRQREDVGEQIFNLELQICSHRTRAHAQLIWQGYSVLTRYRNGQESSTTFELPPTRFPPFWFSRVKSYTAESENPLQ